MSHTIKKCLYPGCQVDVVTDRTTICGLHQLVVRNLTEALCRFLRDEGCRVSPQAVSQHVLRLSSYILIPRVERVREVTEAIDPPVFCKEISVQKFVEMVGRGRSVWRWVSKGYVPSRTIGRNRFVDTKVAILIYFVVNELKGPCIIAGEVGMNPSTLVKFLGRHPEIPTAKRPFGIGKASNFQLWSEDIERELIPRLRKEGKCP